MPTACAGSNDKEAVMASLSFIVNYLESGHKYVSLVTSNVLIFSHNARHTFTSGRFLFTNGSLVTYTKVTYRTEYLRETGITLPERYSLFHGLQEGRQELLQVM